MSDQDVKNGTVKSYGLDCSGDWPRQYCRQGLLMASVIRYPSNTGSSTDPCCNPWFMYTLKLTKHFGDRHVGDVPIIVIDYTRHKTILNPLSEINNDVEGVDHPFWGRWISEHDRNVLRKKVFTPTQPMFWDVLQDYVTAIPDKVEEDDEVINIQKDTCIHKVHFGLLHNIIVKAVHYKQLNQHATNFLNNILSECGKTLPEISLLETTQLKMSTSLEVLFKRVIDRNKYIPQTGGLYTVYISVRGKEFTHEVTDVQVLLALVIVERYYPAEWKKLFFWHTWLVVTIWLGLLKKVSSDSCSKLLPHLWILKVFNAELLVECPDKVHCLLIVSNLSEAIEEVSYIEISIDNQQLVPIPTDYLNSDKGVEYCSKAGVLLVDMDRRAHIDKDYMKTNNYHHVWLCYILRLAKYCNNHSIPVILHAANDDNLEQCLINDATQVICPQKEPITVNGRQGYITISKK